MYCPGSKTLFEAGRGGAANPLSPLELVTLLCGSVSSVKRARIRCTSGAPKLFHLSMAHHGISGWHLPVVSTARLLVEHPRLLPQPWICE